MARRGIVVVGGGIVGLAAAHALSAAIDASAITVVEKEDSFARHQSGRNSGVVHSGVYYRPGSRKARFCRQGRMALLEFCQSEGIRVGPVGKLIIAVGKGQRARLRALQERGEANGVRTQWLAGAELRELEPRARGEAALLVPETAIVDFGQVASRLAHRLEERGAKLLTGCQVTRLEERDSEVRLTTSMGSLRSDYLVNCAGVHADRLASMLVSRLSVRIVPFRGEYFRLGESAARGLSGRCLYPVPDPDLPFLGVHLTPTLEGRMLCGPNAVLALAKEGYHWGRVGVRDLWQVLAYGGFWRLAARHWRAGLEETARSLSRRRFAKSLGSLIEGVRPEDLAPWPAGVRAQAVTRDGALVDDFMFEETARTLHVINAPSPAATASLRIGEEIARRVGRRWRRT